MQKRMIRWMAAGLVALALGVGMLAGGANPRTAYGADPTPRAGAARVAGYGAPVSTKLAQVRGRARGC